MVVREGEKERGQTERGERESESKRGLERERGGEKITRLKNNMSARMRERKEKKKLDRSPKQGADSRPLALCIL